MQLTIGNFFVLLDSCATSTPNLRQPALPHHIAPPQQDGFAKVFVPLGTNKRMITSRFEYVDKLIAILDACQVDFDLELSFNWPLEYFDTSKEENLKPKALSRFVNNDWTFKISAKNKEEFLSTLADTLNDGDFCHYYIKVGKKEIGKGYDNFGINFLDPDYFQLTEKTLLRLGDSDIYLKKEIEKD